MIKYYCDRCKKEIKEYYFISSGEIGCNHMGVIALPREYQICKSCYKQLIKFMENK